MMSNNLAKNLHQNLGKLGLEATLADLPLWDLSVEITTLTKEVVKLFENDAVTPGVLLKKDGLFCGMLSRRRFLKRMSRPYALELFLHRPLSTFDNIENFAANVLSGDTPILTASQIALERDNGQMYEPIVVMGADGYYGLVDMPILLQAQSHIHQLTHQLLKEQTHVHMIQTEKMASLGRMLAGIAHEIRNPVNCIHGNMQFLQDYFGDLLTVVEAYQGEIKQPPQAIAELLENIELTFVQEDLPKILQSIEISAIRMTEIVASLGNFSRIDETKKQLVNLPECINSTLLILNNRCRRKGIKIHQDIEPNLPIILGYSGQLSQVLMNILANALDALEEKQEMLVQNQSSGWQPQIDIRVFSQFSDLEDGLSWVCVEIRDNGDGMPQDVQGNIFQDFFTTKSLGKGTGLGLAISNDIIRKKHQGRLEFNSIPGQGTAFLIWLPIETIGRSPVMQVA